MTRMVAAAAAVEPLIKILGDDASAWVLTNSQTLPGGNYQMDGPVLHVPDARMSVPPITVARP